MPNYRREPSREGWVVTARVIRFRTPRSWPAFQAEHQFASADMFGLVPNCVQVRMAIRLRLAAMKKCRMYADEPVEFPRRLSTGGALVEYSVEVPFAVVQVTEEPPPTAGV